MSTDSSPMIVTTTPSIQGVDVQDYLGVQTSLSLVVVPLWKNLFHGSRDNRDHRDKDTEKSIEGIVDQSIQEICRKTSLSGGDALLGLSIHIERVGEQGHLFGVSAAGTSVATNRERNHREFAKRTKNHQGILMTTTPVLDHYSIDEYLGVVHSYAVLMPSVVDDLYLLVKEMAGGRNRKYEKIFEKAVESSFSILCGKAASRGANAVIGIQSAFEHTGGNGGVLMAAMTGTAVKTRNLSGEKTTGSEK